MKVGGLALLLCVTFVGLYAQEEQRVDDSVRQTIESFVEIDEKEVSEVNKIKKMFKKGKASGELKVMYASAPEVGEPYATAIGGILKYELASYYGLSAGVAAYVSYDIPFASGDGVNRSVELSSSEGDYADLGEAYINYRYENFNFRAGRQVIDTPLADSDNIRMIQNSFEAYIATYEVAGFEFMAGNLQHWTGYDADLDEGWSKTGKDGTNLVGVSYVDGLEFSAWYYNITGFSNAAYFDLGFEYEVNDKISLHTMVQYLYESELDKSGTEASIYGFMAEAVAYGVGINFAMNKSEKFDNKASFSGFGGGALFTNMDTMIIDEITQDREVLSYVTGFTYTYKALSFLYAYGDFDGKEDSSGVKAHIREQNIGLGYNFNDELSFGALYAIQDDLEDSANDWNRMQVIVNYNF